MNETTTLKNKLILLVILSLAAGVIITFSPENNPKQINLAQNSNKTKDNLDNKNAINCYDNYNSELSMITKNQKVKTTDSCLFVGCSGFSF